MYLIDNSSAKFIRLCILYCYRWGGAVTYLLVAERIYFFKLEPVTIKQTGWAVLHSRPVKWGLVLFFEF